MTRRVGKNLAVSLALEVVGLGVIGAAIFFLNACGARPGEKATADNSANTNQAASPSNTPTVTPAMSPAATNSRPNPPTEKTMVEKPTLVPPDSQGQQNSSAQSTPMPAQTSPISTSAYGVGSGSGGGSGTGPGRGGDTGYNPNPVRSNPGNTDYGRVFTGREVNQRARVLQKPEPVYTAAARQNEVTGTVILSVVLTAGGQVTDIKIVRGLPDGLNESAIAAARRLKFTPAMLDGHPVSMYIQLEYNFNLY